MLLQGLNLLPIDTDPFSLLLRPIYFEISRSHATTHSSLSHCIHFWNLNISLLLFLPLKNLLADGILEPDI